jgi:hypothetical protein
VTVHLAGGLPIRQALAEFGWKYEDNHLTKAEFLEFYTKYSKGISQSSISEVGMMLRLGSSVTTGKIRRFRRAILDLAPQLTTVPKGDGMYIDCDAILREELADWDFDSGVPQVVIGIDGQNPLTKRKKLEMATLKVVNRGSVADSWSPVGCRALTIIKGPEDREMFAVGGPLAPVGEFASRIIKDGGIMMEGQLKPVEISFSVDYVAACLLLGFNAMQKGKYCCPWCEIVDVDRPKWNDHPERRTDDLNRYYKDVGRKEPKFNYGMRDKSILTLPDGCCLNQFVPVENLHVLLNCSLILVKAEMRRIGKDDPETKAKLLVFFNTVLKASVNHGKLLAFYLLLRF